MNHVQTIILLILPLMLSIILHEVSHGWVAEKLGRPHSQADGPNHT